MSISDPVAIATLGAIKAALDGGFLHVFNGPVPADADDALDMVTDHTLLMTMSESADGVTGLTFETPTGAVMPKTAAETWEGLIGPFDGANDGEASLAPTFYRFCESGDNGQGAGATQRLQGTCGGPTSGAALTFDVDELTPDGLSTKGVGIYTVTADQTT